MVKGTGKALVDDEGKEITAEKTFTPDTPNGEVEIVFEYDASLLAGETIVAFEKLYHNGIEVEAHEDIDDEGQTIRFPKIGTKALGGDGKKLLNPAKDTIIIDTVSYENFSEDGVKIKAVGKLVEKSTGKVITTVEKELTVKGDDTFDMEFTVDTRLFEGEKLVVYEYIYDEDDNLISEHEDIDDDDQTVTVKTSHPKTGDIPLIPVGLTFIFIGGIMVFINIRKKKTIR